MFLLSPIGAPELPRSTNWYAHPTMPSAEIITIGTELLLGETADTNTRFIARTLRNLGIHLFHTTTIGDNTERIAQAIREALGVPRSSSPPEASARPWTPLPVSRAQAVGVEVEYHAGTMGADLRTAWRVMAALQPKTRNDRLTSQKGRLPSKTR